MTTTAPEATTATRTPRPQPTAGATLGEIIAYFLTKPSPRIISGLFLVATAARVAVGQWGWWDLGIPLVIVALEPFTEWAIHVGILHWKPRRVGRFTIDPITARKHRAHHADPRNLESVMVPFEALFTSAPVAIALALWRLPLPRALTALAAGFAMLLTYEWTHYLIHAPHRPRSAWFRKRSRNHRLHHFKSEHYWFGVTTNFGDRVLRTNPDERSVPTSPTARTLGVTT